MKRIIAMLAMSAFVFSGITGFAQNKSRTFTFEKLPTNVEELKALPEANLQDPYGTVALTLAVLCNYEADVNETIAMLDYLRGPDPMSGYAKQFIKERLQGKYYKPRPRSRIPLRYRPIRILSTMRTGLRCGSLPAEPTTPVP